MAKDSAAGELHTNLTNVKETIESILVAFILAFIFRAFIVEAFVIPTGSMGPTLMGAHLRLTCPDCGYHFQANYNANSRNPDSDDTDIPSTDKDLAGQIRTCPNCGYHIVLHDNPAVYFGDRILVLKYRYLFQQPDPWDVVVFKSPYESRRDPDDPKYDTNYIKRLIGRPGESIMILDGDIYVGGPHTKPQDFKIRRKNEQAQAALWRDVYDNDYLSHGLSRDLTAIPWQEPWYVEKSGSDKGSGWTGPNGAGDPGRIFAFDDLQGESAIQFDSMVNHSNFDSLTDWLAYDQGTSGNYVSDLKLKLQYRKLKGDGSLKLQLTKRDDCFTAEIVGDKVLLWRHRILRQDPLQLGQAAWPTPLQVTVPSLLSTQSPPLIEFTNVDYRVSVRVNGKEVLATDDSTYGPNVAALYDEAIRTRTPSGRRELQAVRPQIRVVAAQQACEIGHLAVAKDGYYLNDSHRYTEAGNGNYSQEMFFASPENIMHLGPDEYFVLGDNSQVSLDARFWGAPVNLPVEGNYQVPPGRVPGRFLLGKAFFVYWPAGYRIPSTTVGVEPDFGDMRLIH